MLKTRVKTGLALAVAGFILIFCLGLFFPLAWWILFCVIVWEWAAMKFSQQIPSAVAGEGKAEDFSYQRREQRIKKIGYVAAFLCCTAFAYVLPLLTMKMGLLFWIAAAVSLFFSRESLKFLVSKWGYFLTGMLLLVPAWSSGLYLYYNSPWLLLYVVLVIAASDIGAYFVGKKWGKHYLAPEISPKKTWEGAFGGLICGLVLGCIFGFFANHYLFQNSTFSILRWGFLSLILVIFGVVGDLFESQIKRLLGVKDSGKLLPGHGGFLDRFDSHFAGLLIAAFMIWI